MWETPGTRCSEAAIKRTLFITLLAILGSLLLLVSLILAAYLVLSLYAASA